LRKFLEDAGHTLVVTSSKDGEDSVLDKESGQINMAQGRWLAKSGHKAHPSAN
jgi:formate dehydrogenase